MRVLAGLALGLAVFLSAPALPAWAEMVNYRWVTAGEGEPSDYLAVIDDDKDSPSYGAILSKIEIGSAGHIPYALAFTDDGTKIWVTLFRSDRIFIFDVASDPMDPQLAQVIDNVLELTGFSGPYAPSPYDLIPGEMIVKFAVGGDGAGGVGEFTNDGELLAAVVGTEPGLASCCPLLLGSESQDSAQAER